MNLNEKEERDVKRFEEKKAPRPEPFETKRKDVLEHQGERPGEKSAAALNTVSYRQIAPPKPSLVKEPDISDMMPDWLKERKKAEEGELDEQIRAAFQTSVEEREQRISEAAENLECAFDFCETAFGEGQELVVFVTELTVNRYSAWFIGENGCDRYYKYNKGLLFRERQKGILEEMDEVRDLMEGRKE